MKLILPQVQILHQEKGINGVFKAIAQAGRVCYASTREGDEEEFVQRCIRMNHMRPLEFGTVYLKFDKLCCFFLNLYYLL
jgi:thymidylate synthase ThyX